MNKKLAAMFVALTLMLSTFVGTGVFAAQADSSPAPSEISSVSSSEEPATSQAENAQTASDDTSSLLPESSSSTVSSSEAPSSSSSSVQTASSEVPLAPEAATVFSSNEITVQAGQNDFDLATQVTAQDENGLPLVVTLAQDGGFSLATPGVYQVVYQAVHPSLIGPTTAFIASDSGTVTAPVAPSQDGYNFVGWSTDATDVSKVTTSFTANEVNSTYYAIWQSNAATYTVTYDANGALGTVPEDTTEYAEEAEVTVLAPSSLTKEGYTFAGWKNSVDNLTYQTGATFPITQNTTLTAQWTLTPIPVTYSVTYNANSGEGTVPVDGKQYSANELVTTLSAAGLTRNGYTFAGWKNSVDNQVYQTGASFPITQNTTLTAQWTAIPVPVTYSVTYNANGGEGTVPVDGKQYKANELVTVLSGAGLTRNGYTFAGWSNSWDKQIYQATGVFTIAENIVLTAQWAPVAPPASSSSAPTSSTSSLPASSSSSRAASSSASTPAASSSTAAGSSSNTASVASSRPAASSAQSASVSSETAATSQPVSNTTLGDTRVPLFNQNAAEWALLNLLIAIATTVISILLLVSFFRKKDNGEQNETASKIFRILAVVAGLIAPIFFFLTESMSRKMVFIDMWTIPTLLFFIAQAIFILIMAQISKRNKNYNKPY